MSFACVVSAGRPSKRSYFVANLLGSAFWLVQLSRNQSLILNQTNFDYGKAEPSKLATKYEHLLGLAAETTHAKLQSEYNDLKFILKEKLQSGSLKTFADVICFVLTEEKFSTMATFVDICGTFQASSADAERGFSLMNNIKTKLRNRLEVDHLDMIMRIKFYLTNGQTVDLDRVYKFWKGKRNRREHTIYT